MKIGVYFPDIRPESGGAGSLLKTIQNEILLSKDSENEYVFLYHGGKAPLITNFENFDYLNLDCYKKSKVKRFKERVKKALYPDCYIPGAFDFAAKENDIDLFWFTSSSEVDINYPYIYTVWDLGHRRTPYFPEVSRSGWLWDTREFAYQKMLYKASYIITGNEEGKKEILENYPLPEGKIRIAPFPVASFCRGNEEKPDFELAEKFFFYPAQFWPHKNHISIVEALKILRDKYNLTPSVYLSGTDWGNKDYIVSKIKEYNLENQIKFTGFLKDENMKYLYTHATAIVFASLMGPNNMPPIEATFLNCPVIITNLDGHKEQLGDTALYFNGYDYEDLASKMKLLLTDEKEREALKAKEKVLAKEFDSISYFAEIKKVIDEFSKIRKTWGKDFSYVQRW